MTRSPTVIHMAATDHVTAPVTTFEAAGLNAEIMEH
jgi:hypothetical protein